MSGQSKRQRRRLAQEEARRHQESKKHTPPNGHESGAHPVQQKNRATTNKNGRPNDGQQGEKNAPSADRMTLPVTDKGREAPKAAKHPKDSSNEQSPTKPLTRDQTRNHRRCTLIASIISSAGTAVSAVIALITLLVVNCQLTAMRNQSGIMSGQLKQMQEDSRSSSQAMSDELSAMKEQGSIMGKQLGVMDEQLREMRASAQLEQRAWVGLSGANHKPIVSGQKIEAQFRFANTGRTPAIIDTGGRTFCIKPSGYDMEAYAVAQEKAWTNETRSRGPLAPNAVMTIDLSSENFEISDSLVADIKSGKTCVFVVGRIVYHDFFGKEHQTRFCYTADPDTDHMTEYHQYNYMD